MTDPFPINFRTRTSKRADHRCHNKRLQKPLNQRGKEARGIYRCRCGWKNDAREESSVRLSLSSRVFGPPRFSRAFVPTIVWKKQLVLLRVQPLPALLLPPVVIPSCLAYTDLLMQDIRGPCHNAIESYACNYPRRMGRDCLTFIWVLYMSKTCRVCSGREDAEIESYQWRAWTRFKTLANIGPAERQASISHFTPIFPEKKFHASGISELLNLGVDFK